MIDRRSFLAGALAPTCRVGSNVQFPAVDAWLSRLVSDRQLAGVAVRIARDGEVLFRSAHGWADAEDRRSLGYDAIYRAYSMTKPIAAAAVALLAEAGQLDLDAPLTERLPELAQLKVLRTPESGADDTRPARSPPTARHLLTHTAGFTNNWNRDAAAAIYTRLGLIGGAWFRGREVRDLADFAARLGQAPLLFEPGHGWNYSLAFDLCGLLVERVTGQSFGRFLETRIFHPLGMTDTGFSVPAAAADRLTSVYQRRTGALVRQESGASSPFLLRPNAEAGASGLVTTLEDYGRFADVIACGGVRKGVRVLAAATVAQMTSPQVPSAVLGEDLQRFSRVGSGAAGSGLGFGLGGSVVVDPAATRATSRRGDYSWGGAASTTFFASPETRLSAVLMTQLQPSGTYPLHDALKTAVFADLGLGPTN